jgi:hypothetical protein
VTTANVIDQTNKEMMIVGMDSEKLSMRERGPGDDQTFRHSEKEFVRVLDLIFPKEEWIIEDHPTDLSRILSDRFGVIPEASLTNRITHRTLFFEVKKQNERGNADERACKHHTVQFYRTLQEKYKYAYHPFVTIMCDALATHERYTLKHPYFYEDDHYFCWVDYDFAEIRDFLTRIADMWLKD